MEKASKRDGTDGQLLKSAKERIVKYKNGHRLFYMRIRKSMTNKSEKEGARTPARTGEHEHERQSN